MAVPVPFSPVFVLLLLGWPAAWLLGRAITHAITTDRSLRAVLPPGIALSLWLLSVHVASLASGSLRRGLPAGTLLVAGLGVAAEIARRRRAPTSARACTGRAPSAWMRLTMLASTAVIAPAAIRFDFHDELYITGHMSVAAEMQNGVYPPRHLTFPDLSLRYHYGFDLLVACLTALFRLNIEAAIDAAILGLWALTWCLLWVLGERVAGRRLAWLTPVLVLFGGGLPLGCPRAGTAIMNVIEECKVGALPVNPPIVSYFFQHPWSLGIPVALTAILIFHERRATSERARLATLCALLAWLSMSELVLFAGLLPSLVVASFFDEEGALGARARRALLVLAVAVAAALGARMLGGFFVRVPDLPPLQLALHAGFSDTWRETLVWNGKTFGVLLPLGIAGLLVMRRGRMLCFLIAAGSLAVLNGVRYGLSADIMKFGALATLALGVAASAALARLARGAAPRSPARAAMAALLAVVACAWGSLFPLFWALDLAEIPGPFRTKPDALSADDVRAVVLLRGLTKPGEMIYRGSVATHGYAQWGGLPQPMITWSTKAFGFSPERIAARDRLNFTYPPDAREWAKQGFRWFVLDGSKEDAALRKNTDRWITEGRARLTATFGALRVIELR